MPKQETFTTIHTEGALLPPDLLQAIAVGSGINGVTPEAYHLPGEKLNEAITRSWNRLLGAWANFKSSREKLIETDTGTTTTRERWLLPLFQELGYGRLQTSRAFEIEEKTYPISHMWEKMPIHLISYRYDLDQRTPGVAGASRTTPHGLVQEFLNRTDDYLWAFVSNGLQLRILRDNSSLTRQAYLEFDLESMMEGEVYADFALLWLVCHQSRVEGDKPEEFWLEKWSRFAQEKGKRVLEKLRDGVEKAISALGAGFITCPSNRELREALRSGQLDKQEYYRQLLRVVYRLIFLFVAEDRDVLLLPDAPAHIKDAYHRFYSMARLRRLAVKQRGTQHIDLMRGLWLIFEKLGNDQGCPELALPALGSFLWSQDAVAGIADCDISNRDFLKAINALAFTKEENTRRTVDFRNLGSEELGSVYESLLELHPVLNLDAGAFVLETAGGHERKTTASYYTRTELIDCVLNSALEPELVKACQTKNPEQALLNLKIADPACGSGHFLVASAHRIAKRLAAVRTGDDEPSPEATRHALRDVIGHCIYGVDINPMSVELCKVSLWMEAIEPGKPLSFLDHRILCGNSLIGTTPALLRKGILDAAFDLIEGDDKSVSSEYRKRNRIEQQQPALFDAELQPWERLGDLAASLMSLDQVDDSTIDGIHQKQQRYEAYVRSSGYLFGSFLADTWCAAFFWQKTKDFPYPITQEIFRRIEKNPHVVTPWMRDEIVRLARQYQFFHWHLAFSDVFFVPGNNDTPANEEMGWSGGFDVVLGNPPWDTLSPDAKEFFSAYNPQIRNEDKDGQTLIMEELLQDPLIAEQWAINNRMLYSTAHFIKESGRYRLFASGNLGKGDFNIFRMFVELEFQNTRDGCHFAQVVPEGLYNGANSMALRKVLFDECKLDFIYGFENKGGVWFDAHRSLKFCVYSACKGGPTKSFHTAFNIKTPEQLIQVLAGDVLTLPVSLVKEFSPDALAIMELGNQTDINIVNNMYELWPKFGDSNAGSPHRHYMREIDMGTDRELFDEDPTGLPLYEGRMVDIFDYRAKGYRSGRGRSSDWEDMPFGRPDKSIQPQWYMPVSKIPRKIGDRIYRYRIGFCDVLGATNERSLMASLIPPDTICGHSVPTIVFEPEYEWCYLFWLAVADSYAMDYLARQKVSLHMTYTILDSLPFPRLTIDDTRVATILPIALRLMCTGPEMTGYWNMMANLGWADPIPVNAIPPGYMDEETRLQARAELDAIVARDLFNLSADQMAYILETFPTIQRREEAKYGEFRTKRLILEAY
ncbi:MAG: Eco57I restriction-modification methylase domain-containing protein [Armatimonadota bacterium]